MALLPLVHAFMLMGVHLRIRCGAFHQIFIDKLSNKCGSWYSDQRSKNSRQRTSEQQRDYYRQRRKVHGSFHDARSEKRIFELLVNEVKDNYPNHLLRGIDSGDE